MGDKGDKNAARPPEGSLVEIKGPKSAIVPFPEPRSGPKSRTGSGAPQKAKSREQGRRRRWYSDTGKYTQPSRNTTA